jgi:enoyl-CoA hydratase
VTTLQDGEIIVSREGALRRITLNRPKALNALTLAMSVEMTAHLHAWASDPEVGVVLLDGAGDRAFCAGGDIRALFDAAKAGTTLPAQFWSTEYYLDVLIGRYPKPLVVLMDGLVMGGGVGLSGYAAFRIVTERSAVAMPEVGIGFFPDVGATYALPRLPHRAGRYFALTGERANAADALAFGVAGAFVESGRFPALVAALQRDGETGDIIAQFKSQPQASTLVSEAGIIERCFADESILDILAALAAAAAGGSPLAQTARAAMLAKSPTSQAIALRQMQFGTEASFEEAMEAEFRIVSRICRGHDFYEGVRAVIVDKDNAPNWRPAAHAEVAPADVDAYFAPLGPDDLAFDTEAT